MHATVSKAFQRLRGSTPPPPPPLLLAAAACLPALGGHRACRFSRVVMPTGHRGCRQSGSVSDIVRVVSRLRTNRSQIKLV
jgi:hypothetical protein